MDTEQVTRDAVKNLGLDRCAGAHMDAKAMRHCAIDLLCQSGFSWQEASEVVDSEIEGFRE